MGGATLRDTGKAPLFQRSSRDLNHQTKLKLRQVGQNAPSEIEDRELLKAKLLRAEQEHQLKLDAKRPLPSSELDPDLLSKRRMIAESNLDADDDVDDDDDDSEDGRAKKGRGGDDASDNGEAGSADDDDDDDDEDDDTAELMRELEKIKRERAEEKEREERERREAEEQAREEAMMAGNPILQLNSSSGALQARDFSVQRRWDDDVVFKNQARGQDGKVKKRFINDLVRSDFHRKFMAKCKRDGL
ncbi:hypothetical protein HK405_001676, partial [Cladochytrium tenue]